MNIRLSSNEIGFIDVHYFLQEKEDHSVDAFILNTCERELLQFTRHIGLLLHSDIAIESQALSEGGVLSRLKIKASAKNITLVCTVLTTLMTGVLMWDQVWGDEEIEALKKRDLELSIMERERSLGLDPVKKEEEKSHVPASSVGSDRKLQIHRSNYYKSLNRSPKVIKVSFAAKTDLSVPIKERFVPRADFEKFIVADTTLPLSIDSDAEIEIVSPVLRYGHIKWRGIYQGRLISFSIKDSTYKQAILEKRVTFSAGSKINCILEIKRKLDDSGNEIITSYAATYVGRPAPIVTQPILPIDF